MSSCERFKRSDCFKSRSDQHTLSFLFLLDSTKVQPSSEDMIARAVNKDASAQLVGLGIGWWSWCGIVGLGAVLVDLGAVRNLKTLRW